jgi:hypothetical protein
MSVYRHKPRPFFELVIHDVASRPGLTGASAGYELGRFRNQQLADYLFEWLPEFALKYSELEEFNSGTGMRLVRRAAQTVYTTDKYKRRGEFGELLLHALLREVFDSEPAISKLYYKSATNDTVKGFDAVHVVEMPDGLELWLGEVKLYKDASAAVTDVATELKAHTAQQYLRNEFILIDSKIDPHWKHATTLKELISGRKSLDDVFARTCIPVLLTYESASVAAHKTVCDEFRAALKEEMLTVFKKFTTTTLPDIRIHLFLVPLHEKKDLIAILHAKLEGMQR